ncbi:hypothetical protein DNTS_015007, partial [Danionella cerebrum]
LDQGYIHCSTNNHGSLFQCFWTWGENREGHVIHIAVTRSHTGSNISCSVDPSGMSITCVDHDYCAFAEELEQIKLTLYFRSIFVIESYSTKFYIMDIVKPDVVAFKKINQTLVELGYPESWNTPFSYFPLIFQVKEIGCRKKKKCNCSRSRLTEAHITQSLKLHVSKGKTVCVRAKDEFCDSPWSDWNQYRFKRNQKQKKT